MNEEPYDCIISLGEWCATAANIRRKFNLNSAMPFDWWITPYFPLMKLIEENFEHLFRDDNLEITFSDGGKRDSVKCNHYGILHHHDFQRNENHEIIPDIDYQLKNAAEKSSFIINRFYRSIKGKRVLFIRSGLYGQLWSARDGIPFQTPSAEEQINRATKLHHLVATRLQARETDIMILSNIDNINDIKFETGSLMFENLGPKIGETAFWVDNYDAVFERRGIALKAQEIQS